VAFSAGFLMMGGPGETLAAPAQWDTASGGNGHWYEFVANSQISWSDALTVASSNGGYLATVTSAAENTFIKDLVLPSFGQSAPPMYSYVWLAGSDAGDEEGNWKWMAGPEVGTAISPYINWYAGEPNNYYNEDYLTMIFFNTVGTWNDFANTNLYVWAQSGYVVESNSSPVPIPGTLLLLGSGVTGLIAARRKAR